MVRLNKNELSPKQLEELFKQLGLLLSTSSDKNVGLLLEKLLGPEERIMLAKRLAAAVLLEKGYAYNQVADALHVSKSTVSNIDQRLGEGGVTKIAEILKQDKASYSGILKLVESILTVGGIMPSRAGLDRYKGIR